MAETNTQNTDKVRVVAKLRQCYSGKEAEAKDRYCVLIVSPEKKRQLLVKEQSAESEVMVAFFRSELLLIGNGLTHQIKFIEEKDVVGRHQAFCIEL